MKLSRIRIEQFRQFRQPLEITGLHAGLNLFTGPNEAGKSTVVAAIRAAFFERHRSGSVEDLRPWGDSTAAPSVELDFEVGATAYRLRKSFLARKRCELQEGGQALDGAAAEDRLAELLGFQYAGKGASAAQHWGIPGLLWVSQGSGQQIDEPLTHAADHLRSALNASLGEVASSGGDDVLAAVEAQRNELLTRAGGAPREAYAEALRAEAEAGTALQQLDLELQQVRQQVDQLDALRRAHQADVAEQPWAQARQQEQAARQRLAAAQGLQAALAAEHQRLQQLQAQQQWLRQQLHAAADEDAALARRRAAQLEAEAVLASALARVAPCQAQFDAASATADAARAQLRRARQADQHAVLARERQALLLKSSATAAALQRAEAAQSAVLALQAQVEATTVPAAALKTLRHQAQRLRELQIQRDAVATRLRFSLTPGHGLRFQPGVPGPEGSEPDPVPTVGVKPGAAGDVQADTAPLETTFEWLSGEGERLLAAPATLDLGALGRLHISPGGADLAELARDQAGLADAQYALLQTLGLASLDAAEARQLSHGQHQSALQAAAASLRALAPEGVDVLRRDAQAQAARARDLQALLADADGGPPADRDPAAATAPDAPAEPQALQTTSLPAAERAEEAARRSAEQAQTRLTESRLAVGQAQAQADAAARELAAALSLVTAADRASRLQAAQQALGDALAEQQSAQARAQSLNDQLAQARPDQAQLDVQRYQRSAQAAEQAHAERQTALLRLEAALESAGARGLDERRALLAARHAQAGRRAQELRRRAAALDHLLSLLRAKRSALTLRLQAPLQRHIDHYLPLLLPQAQLQIDTRLAPAVLTRPGAGAPAAPETGPFEALSFGAREQMALICRLAYADLLREAGRPTLLILDDALVHSDDERLAQMKRILFDAATRHQVLLFSCHPAQWRDLGVAARTLDSLRWAAAA